MNFIVYTFTLLCLIVVKPEKLEVFSETFNLNLSITYFLLLFFFLLYNRKYDKNWMRFDVIFLLAYTIVHIQIPFLASIGIEPLRPSFVWINKDVVNYATWLSVTSINLWMLGYSIVLRNKKISSIKKSSERTINLKIIDLFLLSTFIGLIISAGSVILSGVYNVEMWGSSAVYLHILFKCLLYLRIIYFFKGIAKSSSIKDLIISLFSNHLFVLILLSYSTIFLLTGSRGEVLNVLLVSALSYSIFVRKLSFKLILSLILAGSFLFTIIGLGRVGDVTKYDPNTNLFERGYEAFNSSDERPLPTNELATSIRILYRALHTVPDFYSYLYGKTYAVGIFGVIPFAASLVADILNFDDKYLGSSNFFTYLGQGDNPAYGEGSEILADLYINFGVTGTLLIMLIFGLFSGHCYVEARKKRDLYIILYTVLIVSAFTINRGSIFYIYKLSFYLLILYFLLTKAKK